MPGEGNARPSPLPATPAEITPDWLTDVLRASGTSGRAVAAVTCERIGEGYGLTGVVSRLHLRYEGERGDAPPSLVAKFPMAAPGTLSAYRAAHRRDAAARRYYERCAREVRFYREIAPRSMVPAPRLYHGEADDATGRIVLLLEDLAAARTGDVLRGCTRDEARLVAGALAPFHARWWPRSSENPTPFPWLPRWGGDHCARQERYNRQVTPFLDRYGGQLPPAIRDIVEGLRTRYGAVLAALDAAPATIIHADLHLDNIAFNPPRIIAPAVVFDWQSVCLGPAAIDIAQFMFGSLDVGERRRAEGALFRHYHALLTANGVAGYGADRLRHDCRLALLRQLAGTVGWLAGVDAASLAGRERALVEAAIGDGRLIAALLDYDVAALLT